MKDKEKQIISFYGVLPQLKYMQTEMFEFIEAILTKELVGAYPGIKEKQHIEEEYADLMVMLEQFHAYYDLDDMHISEVMHQKIDRQLDRIAKEK